MPIRMPGRDIRVLAFHAAYRCRNSGVCCTSDWPIPIETDRLGRMQAALARGRLRPVQRPEAAPFVYLPDAPADTPAILARCGGACVFHEPAGRCAIHTALDHDALPLACRQFPRVSVADPRGVSVTLSHYCPTAAARLGDRHSDGETLLINPATFPPDGEYVGLDATTSLPPLLRPGHLMDWDSWWGFEQLSIDALLGAGKDAVEAVAHVRRNVESLRGCSTPEWLRSELVDDALKSVPVDYRSHAHWREAMPTDDRTTRRFLASHAFANWAIHTEGGLVAWLRSIETAHAFLQSGAGIRHTDLVLRHLAGEYLT